MKKVKSKLIAIMLIALTCTLAANAAEQTMQISINEGTNGSDGWSTFAAGGSGTIGSSENIMRIGYSMNGVAQTYFKIPVALKQPGVTIKSATITMEAMYFAPSSTGIYFQMVHFNYDSGTVSYDNANATNDPAKYTKIGNVIHLTGSSSTFETNWDVKSVLEADITAGNTYLPIGVRMALSDGSFYTYNESMGTYEGLLYSSESGSNGPVLTIVFESDNYYGVENLSINENVNGSDGFSSQVSQGGGSIGNTESGMRIGYGMNAVAQTYFVIPEVLKVSGVQIKSATLKMEFGDFAPGGTGIYYQLVHFNYDTGTVSYDNANSTNDPTKYTKVGGTAHMQGSYPSFVTTWDVKSVLETDLAAGKSYLPFGVRMTRSDGTFYPDSEASNSYYGLLWASEHGGGTPVLYIEYTVPYNQMFFGEFFGLPDDLSPSLSDAVDVGPYPPFPTTPMIRFSYMGDPMGGDMSTDIVIDQLAAKDIQKVLFRNLDGEATSANIRELSMWVAPASGPGSESDPDFDRFNKASYSVQIFPQAGGEGVPQPEVATQGVTREVNVTQVSRRYILMKIGSNFVGDIGQFYPEQGYDYNWEIYLSDISVLGTDSIKNCDDVLDLGLSLSADLTKDCHVNMSDLKIMADEWMQCTAPGTVGCIQVPGDMPVHEIASVPVGGITVDGSLSEWPADSEWVYLSHLYSGDNSYDVKTAKMSLRWDGSTDKIYAAVIVDDPEHNFSDTATYTADLVEIYSQGDAAGGTGWGAGGTKYFDAAQQYFVGHKISTGKWAAWADLTSIASSAGFESAVTLNGDKIIYEIGIKQFNNYGGISGGATEGTDLTAGDIIGLDIVADTVYTNGFSMLSENMFLDKYLDAGQFQQYELVNSLSQRNCGVWGYLKSDISQDCRVNLTDFAMVAQEWLNCDDPTEDNCQNNW
jgi:hypothetical protein